MNHRTHPNPTIDHHHPDHPDHPNHRTHLTSNIIVILMSFVFTPQPVTHQHGAFNDVSREWGRARRSL